MSNPVDPLFVSLQFALAGRYSIDRELGRGGMGIVFLAREVHLDRLVAIKLLPPEKASQPSLRERFLREARLAAKLSHPNIIPIHSVEETDGFVYYVMAFIEGETLAQRVRTRGPLPSSEAARVLREVAWALAYAHGQGLVHRDVKPDNILLESSTGRVLVADFGIAAVSGDVASESVTGTPEFMSPEQALGAPIDARSDLYGWGVTAFYALSGRLPFEGTSATAILARHVTEAAPPLASLGVPVPRRLAALVDRCLGKEPEQRPATATAVAEQLGLALEQRRELPAALRAFVKRNGRLNGGGTLLAGIALVPVSTTVSAFLGGEAGFTAFTLGLTVVPFSYFVLQARRLTRLGFAHADLAPAFKAEIDQATEELTLGRRQGPTLLERSLGLVARVSGAVGGAAVLGALIGQRDLLRVALPTMVWSFATASLATTAWLALRQRHRDVDTAFWSRLWMGPIGRLAFAVARRIAGSRVQAPALTHRPTELSLGMAAEQLYENLPKETRRALGDLPAVLSRLQEDAQLLRKRHDELQEALGDGDAGASDAGTELRATRDTIRARLSEAVGALETIRLNLLRLHAGSATVEGLTTHLGLAAEVSAQIERLISAHDEVASALDFPRAITPTPA
jgi:serine/threonine-protein kinase